MSEVDLNELFDTFSAESADEIAALELGLLALEENPNDRELPLELQRHAHTLKGNASCVGLQAITDFAHVYEDVLERIAHGERAVDRPLVTLLLGGVDTLRRLVGELADGALRDGDRELMQQLRAAVAASTPATPAAQMESAPSADAGQRLRTAAVRVSA